MTFSVRSAWALGLSSVVTLASACGEGGDRTTLDLSYDSSSQRIQVIVGRDLRTTETLHARVRRGAVGDLSCASEFGSIQRIDGEPVIGAGDARFVGPSMTPDELSSPYQGTEWLEGDPTPEMLAAIAEGLLVVDVCLMDGTRVVTQMEFDPLRALDRRGQSGKFDGPEARIASTQAYGEACVAELGEIPFFPRVENGAEWDYETYNCLDSVPIPTTVTAPDGSVTSPTTGHYDRMDGEPTQQCDQQQYIYSSCEPSAVDPQGNERPDVNGPRVASRRNEQGTHWVLLCRKANTEPGNYYDIAMIGHNPYTGRTCFFQNALGSREDGLHVPHPADKVQSDASPETSEHIWSGIHGGLGSGIQCTTCHDADPFIHSPWIDGARDENGDPVVPRMGVDEDFSLGFNDAPYTLVNAEGQGWTMHRQLVGERVAACTSCHRMTAEGRWGTSYMSRMVGEDTSWMNDTTEAYRDFEHVFWMPPDQEGLDETTFFDSPFGQAFRHIQECGRNPSNPDCEFADLPTGRGDGGGALPSVELEGAELATAALIALGADVQDPSCPDGECGSRRCNSCHAVSRRGLHDWLDFTRHGWDTCGLTEGREDPQASLLAFLNSAEKGILETIEGVGEDRARRIVEARPFASLDAVLQLEDVTAGTLRPIQDIATGAPETMSEEDARRAVDCLRSDRDDPTSVFAAENLGIMATGVQYSYFRRLFQRAYGDDWALQYGQFRSRVSMPKGSHPAMSQREYATLLAWFRSGLTNLDEVLREPPPPSTCDNYVDTAAISSHVDAMRFEGWQAVNEDNGIRMFGCSGADAQSCFTAGDFPDESSTWGNAVGTIRQLRQLDFRTSFWMRSSADGRFVGNGGSSVQGYGATITDLLTGRNIGIQASYDPAFFPDNSGWMFQGGGNGAGFCTLSVLESGEEGIDFSEVGCTRQAGISLYQHVARGLNGGDYFVINSQNKSNAGRTETTHPSAAWTSSATMTFHPMIFNGTTYERREQVIVDAPFEGDSVLSPSGQLVGSRMAGPDGVSLGYVVHRVNTQRFGADYRITLGEPIVRICDPGAKTSFSFDERFMVTHHHDGDVANIYVYDLLNGTSQAVTNMPSGMRALFPHFRSDGWIYFLVIDTQTNREFIAASDAAIHFAQN